MANKYRKKYSESLGTWQSNQIAVGVYVIQLNWIPPRNKPQQMLVRVSGERKYSVARNVNSATPK